MDDWLQWLKTIGSSIIDEEAGHVIVDTNNGKYSLDFLRLQEHYIRISVLDSNKPADSLFIKKLRVLCRKSHYCVSCMVCAANCKFGNLQFDSSGQLTISDKCTKCGNCLEIDTGCYVYKSLWLSKGLGSMNKKKINRLLCSTWTQNRMVPGVCKIS